jgi:hypothetical protein
MSTKTISKRVVLMDTSYGSKEVILESSIKSMAEMGWVQASQPVEVEFTLLPNDEVVSNHVAALDQEIERVKNEAMEKVNRLQKRRQDYLAINHDSSPQAVVTPWKAA